MITKLTKVTILGIVLMVMPALAKEKNVLKEEGIKITYTDQFDEEYSSVIKRIDDPICKDKSKVNGTDPNMIWSGSYAKESVPDACKKTFVTTVGKISPIKQEGIETYGELEVIDFIQKAQTDKNLLLIDARMSPWYMKGTIPSAINISFKLFEPKHPEFETVLETAGVEVDEGTYNFENAKTLLLFCNGIWCPQSTWAIENLLKIGYPKEKLLWYRGGIQSWKMLNLTTIIPKQ